MSRGLAVVLVDNNYEVGFKYMCVFRWWCIDNFFGFGGDAKHMREISTSSNNTF